MEKGQRKLQNVLEDGIGKDLINAGRFCFNCEQIFSDRKCLEEHLCSAAHYICSCGTEFDLYNDMHEHSAKHEPGHQVLDHETIRKRRIEKRIEEERQMKRLQIGDVVWKTPKANTTSTSLLGKPIVQLPMSSAAMVKVSKQSAQVSQVPDYSLLQASFPQNPVAPVSDGQKMFTRIGAPTVDLWTIYQPVVLIPSVRQFNRNQPYTCGKCGLCFLTKTLLITHHSSHVIDKISGCVGCGLLLSSKKVVPRFHVCNTPISANNKYKLITAKPLNSKTITLNQSSTNVSQNLSVRVPEATPSIQWNRLESIVSGKGTSNLHLKNLNARTYQRSNRGHHVTSPLQSKSWNPHPYKPYSSVSFPSKIQSLNTSASTTSFKCRVCHLPFESASLLQRHKCVKAREFMAQQGRGGRQHQSLKRVMPLARSLPVQVNGEKKPDVPFAGNVKKNQVVAVGRDRGEVAVPVNQTNVDCMDDDCYIVESEPDKPAEMIYQVTSSVPIKT